MVEDLKNAINGEHASNLGAVIARNIGDEIGVPSFVVDPVSVDEMIPEARITGISDLEKFSWFHALNHKAVSRKVAANTKISISLWHTLVPVFPSLPMKKAK